ncbi:hypothetical protein [Streptomyces phaeochromogenes]|uniref:hypothetical protein n=1 Tax=Streptomyces phaeochromogenes TaxID=1923 RepID=UPI0033D31A7C
MIKRRAAALFTILAACLCLSSTAQASAVERVIWARPGTDFLHDYTNSGRVYFATDGDHAGAYDDDTDGYSVCVEVWGTPVSTGVRTQFHRCNSDGNGTRKDWNFDFIENTDVTIQASMSDDGVSWAYGPMNSTVA